MQTPTGNQQIQPFKKAMPTLETSPTSLSCLSCAHIDICTLFRAIAPLLQTWEKYKPFEAEALANICRRYVSKEALRVLEENK